MIMRETHIDGTLPKCCIQTVEALRELAPAKIGDAMKCPECGEFIVLHATWSRHLQFQLPEAK
jgi:predicted RNA-binding Zn-ribbon protein involved in translation (DUF1610 family)